MATEREALTMALARIRWQCHGQRDTVLGDDIPTAGATIAAIEAALAAPPVEQQAEPVVVCKDCRGGGYVFRSAGGFKVRRVECDRCGGAGKMPPFPVEQPAPQAGAAEKRWPFVLSPGLVAGLLAEAVDAFKGDMLAAVRNVFIEQSLALRPTEQPTSQDAQDLDWLESNGRETSWGEDYVRWIVTGTPGRSLRQNIAAARAAQAQGDAA